MPANAVFAVVLVAVSVADVVPDKSKRLGNVAAFAEAAMLLNAASARAAMRSALM